MVVVEVVNDDDIIRPLVGNGGRTLGWWRKTSGSVWTFATQKAGAWFWMTFLGFGWEKHLRDILGFLPIWMKAQAKREYLRWFPLSLEYSKIESDHLMEDEK